jgi:hypothetical protein
MQCLIFVRLFSLKMKVRLMRSILSLRLCDTLIISNQTIGFYETQNVGHAVECNLDAIFFDPVTVTIQKLGSSNF